MQVKISMILSISSSIISSIYLSKLLVVLSDNITEHVS